jgi:hypothetical protein
MQTRTRIRRFKMGVQTLFGLRKLGVFIPYRYADILPERPGDYHEIETIMATRRDAFDEVLARIDEYAGALAALEGPPPAPRWRQDWFPRLDAASAYALVRSSPPKRIIEVGSGHSTRFLASALKDARAEAEHLCIDPAPRAALLDLPVTWRNEVLSEHHLSLFAELEAGDIAMFDSSHLLLEGSDVDIQLNRRLEMARLRRAIRPWRLDCGEGGRDRVRQPLCGHPHGRRAAARHCGAAHHRRAKLQPVAAPALTRSGLAPGERRR